MMKWSFCLLLCVQLASGATFLGDYSTNDVSFTAGFIPDSVKIIAGEPLFLTFILSNRNEHTFKFGHAGDNIFIFTATNKAGLPAKPPHMIINYGGFVTTEHVTRDEPFSSRVFLNDWCEFDKPGDYTVTCLCRLDSFRQPIITVFKLTVSPSSPKRIAKIIRQWGNVVETNGLLDEAARALAEFDDPKIIPPLTALIKKEPNNFFAIQALSKFTNTAAADALAPVLKFGDDYEANTARTTIGKLHEADRVACLFLPELTNANAKVRAQNARGLGWSTSTLAFEPLCSLLQDRSNDVRYAAAEAIGRLNDERSYPVLTNCLNDPDFELRIAAVKGLLASGRPIQSEWLSPVIRAANHHYDKFQTYMDAINLIHMNGGDQAAGDLVSYLDFSNPSINDWYNFYLLEYIGAHWKPPYYHFYKWHQDLNRNGTAQELADNRQILDELNAWLEQHEPK